MKDPLRSLIFTDGTVESATERGADLILLFRDYCDGRNRITLVDAEVHHRSPDLCVYEVMDAAFESRDGTGSMMELRDDDGCRLLRVSYRSAHHEPVRPR